MWAPKFGSLVFFYWLVSKNHEHVDHFHSLGLVILEEKDVLIENCKREFLCICLLKSSKFFLAIMKSDQCYMIINGKNDIEVFQI